VADREDLILGVSSNCADPARITPGEDGLVVQVMWRWTADDAIPGGQEALQVEWAGDGPIHLASERLVLPDGLEEDPSGPAAMALDAMSDGSFPFVRFGMEGSSASARQGSLQIPFAWEVDRAPQALDIVVRWAHDDHWMAVVATACEPPGNAASAPATAP
jgi:hypothetical protein